MWPKFAVIAFLLGWATGAFGVEGANVIYEEWRGEYLGDKRIGYSCTLLESLPAAEELPSASRYRLTACLGIPSQKMVSRVVAETGPDLAVRLVRIESETQGTRTEAEGSIVDGNLVVRVTSSGAVSQRIIPAEGGIYLGEVIPWLIARRKLGPGASQSFPVFDPTVLAPGTMAVQVLDWEDYATASGETVRALHAKADYFGIVMDLWVDAEGGLYESRTGVMNIRSLREPREELEDLASFADLDQEALIREASIPAGRRLPDPEDMVSLTVELRGVPNNIEIPSDWWQQILKRQGDTMRLRTGGLGRSATEPARTGELEPFLRPSLLVQSEDPRIRAKAVELVGEATDAGERARRIADWISGEMESELRVSTPSAAEILESMRGDCNEHATLFAALARAAGIPTKICAGIVHQEGRFFYHAWNEIHAPGEGWMAVDTAFNQFPADPTHIKLTEGDLDEHILIAQLVGRLEVEIVDVEGPGK